MEGHEGADEGHLDRFSPETSLNVELSSSDD